MASQQDEGQEVLDDEPKNVLFAMIRQLKIGMDLHRITFPTFVLEPRSMLERITDFMAHQDLLFSYAQLGGAPFAANARRAGPAAPVAEKNAHTERAMRACVRVPRALTASPRSPRRCNGC